MVSPEDYVAVVGKGLDEGLCVGSDEDVEFGLVDQNLVGLDDYGLGEFQAQIRLRSNLQYRHIPIKPKLSNMKRQKLKYIPGIRKHHLTLIP